MIGAEVFDEVFRQIWVHGPLRAKLVELDPVELGHRGVVFEPGFYPAITKIPIDGEPAVDFTYVVMYPTARFPGSGEALFAATADSQRRLLDSVLETLHSTYEHQFVHLCSVTSADGEVVLVLGVQADQPPR